MYKWSPFAFFRITLSFMAGILLAMQVHMPLAFLLTAVLTALAGFGVLYLLTLFRPSIWRMDITGLSGLLSFFFFGALLTNLRTDRNHPAHLLHHQDPISHYTGSVIDYRLDRPHGQITTLAIDGVRIAGEWRKATGKVRLTIRRDTSQAGTSKLQLLYGDRLLIQGAPILPRGPANPNQFDYRRLLALRNIHHQHYAEPHQVLQVRQERGWSLWGASMAVRRLLDGRLQQHIGSRQEYGIGAALLLGVKDDLDNAIRTAYANTGTMHVLAVSGLHVGILYGVLLFFLKGFRQVPGYRILSLILTLVVLWGYAFITGLSPSVLRAVVMFSLLTIGLHFRRRRIGVNGVAVAAFCLLAYQPAMIMEVGFQLSFLAVLAIIYLQPALGRLIPARHRWQKYVWGLVTVSVAAQLATFPLGLYYFHQFPVYFLLSNVIVVPWAGLVLWTGLGFLLVSGLPGLGPAAAWLFESMIRLMNQVILLVEALPQSVLTGISISPGQTLLLYGLLLSGVLYLQFRNKAYLMLTCATGTLLAGSLLNQRWQQANHQSFVVYSIRQKSAFAFLDGPQAILVTGPGHTLSPDEWQYNLWPHWWHHGVRRHIVWEGGGEPTPLGPEEVPMLPRTQTAGGHYLYAWRGLRILVVAGPVGPLPAKPVEIDYLVLQGNPKLTVAELQTGFRIGTLILDNSNQNWYVQRLGPQLAAAGIPYHAVGQEGAFVHIRPPER